MCLCGHKMAPNLTKSLTWPANQIRNALKLSVAENEQLVHGMAVSAVETVLRVVRVGDLRLLELDQEGLVHNGVWDLVGRHFWLSWRLSVQAGAHDHAEPFLEQWELVATDLVSVASHLADVVGHVEDETSVIISPPIQL